MPPLLGAPDCILLDRRGSFWSINESKAESGAMRSRHDEPFSHDLSSRVAQRRSSHGWAEDARRGSAHRVGGATAGKDQGKDAQGCVEEELGTEVADGKRLAVRGGLLSCL